MILSIIIIKIPKKNTTFSQLYYDENSIRKYIFIEPQIINNLDENISSLNNNIFNSLKKILKKIFIYISLQKFLFFFKPN